MINAINGILWGILLTGTLVFTGIRLSIKTGFLQFRAFGQMFSQTFGKMLVKRKKGGISPFAAMSTALSGTMGTGNIIGVGTAIALGGPGALLWMIISALLCMIIKFAEVALGVKYRTYKNGGYKGGAMYYITAQNKRYRPLAIIFAAATILTSFGIGAAAQSVAVSSTITKASPVNALICGIALCSAAACVIFGTAKQIIKFTSYLVPIMTLTYFIGAAFVLLKSADELIPSICTIINSAFTSPNAAGGGIAGMLTSSALRHGFSKGMFTNEAGMGSAPIVHAAADNTPYGQGLWGMLEVFLDTIVMCSLTGLVIMVTGCSGMSADSMTYAAFCSVFGNFGGIFIAFCVTLFAFGAIVGWCYYGTAGCEFLFKNPAAVITYKLIYCAVIICGAVLPVTMVFELSDILNAFMALPNLAAVNMLAKDVAGIAENGSKGQ